MVLHLGNGDVPAIAFRDTEEPCWIKIPDEYLIIPDEDPIKQIAGIIYPALINKCGNADYLRQRCILLPSNDGLDAINDYILASMPGETRTLLSSDSISMLTEYNEDEAGLFPIEFLNRLQFPGIPNHRLRLKIGVPIMLLRNLNPSIGLCNGTRLIVTKIGRRIIQAQIITGNSKGSQVYIPRIIMSPHDADFPFIFSRNQFPVKVCFAMPISKCQGQTIENVGVYLPTPVLAHGQLYLAVSLAASSEGLKILIKKTDKEPLGFTQNIVYKEVFNNLHF